MNNTNRALNRIFVFLIGLVLLAVGAATVALAVFPGIADGWDSIVPDVQANIGTALVSTPLFDTGHSWLWVALSALAALIAVGLLVFVVRQGHGQAGRLLTRPGATAGNGLITVDSAVAEDAIAASLAQRADLVSSHVSTYSVKKRSVLKVSAVARRGVSPKDLSEAIERLVHSWDALLGEDVPVVIQLSGGFRTRVSKATKLQ